MATGSRRLRTRDAARLLDLSDRTLERMRARGDGPPYVRLSRGLILYDASEILAWLDSRRIAPDSGRER